MRRVARRLSKPDTAAGVLQLACLKLVKEHERDGTLPTNLRFLFYELIDRGVILKDDDRAYTKVTEAMTILREVGKVPWSVIVDETRELTQWAYSATIMDGVRAEVDCQRLGLWDGCTPLVITESRSLAGVLRNLCAEYLVSLASTNGQCRGFLHTKVAPSLFHDQRVLYFGDWDFSGGHIEQNTRDVLEHIRNGGLEWERLAITEKQIKARKLTVIQRLDGRTKKYNDAVETEALGQATIIKILRKRLDELLPEPLDDVLEREADQRELVTAALDKLAKRAGRGS